jgi:DHA1 family bicyclomycin/chloramphenicol resistance-like MFS transporter
MPTKPMPRTEFIAMMATLFAIVAFSIDGMLPALPRIAMELTPDDVNAAQLIVTSFVLGMGVGTLFAGPISDSFGRKPTILGGVAIYILGAALASMAQSLELLLAARVVQGLGAAGPRIVTLAMVRDLHSGRQMARIVSFAMMIFTLVPAVAPSVGAVIIAGFGWRGIFGAVIGFALVGSLWMVLRQPETLPKARRRPLRLSPLMLAAREVMSHRVVITSIAVQTLVYGALFGTLSSTQQIFDITFGRAASFPMWFAVIALMAGGASFLNATLVVRLGMRLLITVTLGAQVVLSVAMAAMSAAGVWPDWLYFPAYLVWTISVFFMTGLTLGNLNALALEPLGHIAGMAASVNGFIATVLAVALAVPIGLAFNGTPVPLMVAVATLCAAGWGLMQTIPRYT